MLNVISYLILFYLIDGIHRKRNLPIFRLHKRSTIILSKFPRILRKLIIVSTQFRIESDTFCLTISLKFLKSLALLNGTINKHSGNKNVI